MSRIDRRDFLSSVVAGVAVSGVQRSARPRPADSWAQTLLRSPAFRPLPLGDIRPDGWLARQLRIQADGLSGHLDEFWPDVKDSQWFGGAAEGWERAPYWLDGVIPLAWLLDDPVLKSRITAHVTDIVDRQRADGWFAPYPTDAVTKRYDMWAILLVNKVLAQYHAATGDRRALEAVVKSLRAMFEGLDQTPLYGWGKFRWFEGLVPIFHAYEHTRESWLLDLARKLRAQGTDYEALVETDDVKVPTPRRGLWKWTKHVVNLAMAPKAAALSWRLDGKSSDRAFATRMIDVLDRYHGQVTGMFTGDECLSGRNPVQGTELCAVVEFMFSLEQLFSVLGDPVFADRLERVAFNALPAAISPDMWSHQYDQQVNQVQCTINPEHGWSTNGPESNLFGLEPNYGCCTSNMHQGWPKFAANLWMKTPDGGLVATAWAPCRVQATLKGVPVTVSVATDYPFRDEIRIRVSPASPVRFPLLLRVPAWTQNATVRIGDSPDLRMMTGALHRLERTWTSPTDLTIHFPMRARVSVRYNDAVAIERGPLVYALKIGEQWTRVNTDKPHRDLPHADFEVRPTTPWNYGLVLDERRPEESIQFEERTLGERPFSPEGSGVVAKGRGRQIPGWKLVRGWAGELAVTDSDTADPAKGLSDQPVEELTLIPYGCTNIRITEFPRLKSVSSTP
jgi:DUF1680 family protein